MGIFGIGGNARKRDKFFWHTDIHSHVCPGIDDGAPDVETSVELVKGMSEFGITRMIVTPHVTDETFPNTPDVLEHAYAELVKAVDRAGVSMRFDYSAEYRVDDLFHHSLKTGQVRPLPGNYLLIENSWFQERMDFDTVVFELQNRYSLKPILAHPERYPYYWHSPERYELIHSNGVKFQVNLLSLAGHYGKECKMAGEWLLKRDLVSFVGSDLHRQRHLQSIRSYLNSKDYSLLESKANLLLNDSAFPVTDS